MVKKLVAYNSIGIGQGLLLIPFFDAVKQGLMKIIGLNERTRIRINLDKPTFQASGERLIQIG